MVLLFSLPIITIATARLAVMAVHNLKVGDVVLLLCNQLQEDNSSCAQKSGFILADLSGSVHYNYISGVEQATLLWSGGSGH